MDYQLFALLLLALLPLAITINYSINVGGAVPIQMQKSRSADGGGQREVDVPKGWSSTLTTRTDANTGTITLPNGHDITTGDAVDIHWTIGGVSGVQYAVTVGTVSTNSMPFDSGIGDDLPAQGSTVVVSKRVQVNADIDGDALVLLAMQLQFTTAPASTDRGHVDFQDAEDDEIHELDLLANVTPPPYDAESSDSNPYTGDVISKLFVSNGSSTNDAKLKLTWLQDSTP